MSTNVVREFNLSEQRLWVRFLAPLMADREFTFEGHDFIPRRTRLKVYEGPELRSDQLGMGRGWQNVERTATDVTERVLARAREHTGTALQPTAAGAQAPAHRPAAAQGPPAADLLRERLAGRLASGPLTALEVTDSAGELMPEAGEQERLEVARQAVWALLERGVAQLAPGDR